MYFLRVCNLTYAPPCMLNYESLVLKTTISREIPYKLRNSHSTRFYPKKHRLLLLRKRHFKKSIGCSSFSLTSYSLDGY